MRCTRKMSSTPDRRGDRHGEQRETSDELQHRHLAVVPTPVARRPQRAAADRERDDVAEEDRPRDGTQSALRFALKNANVDGEGDEEQSESSSDMKRVEDSEGESGGS